jgi:hypothetical protein
MDRASIDRLRDQWDASALALSAWACEKGPHVNTQVHREKGRLLGLRSAAARSAYFAARDHKHQAIRPHLNTELAAVHRDHPKATRTIRHHFGLAIPGPMAALMASYPVFPHRAWNFSEPWQGGRA